jgi:hypothetical protein
VFGTTFTTSVQRSAAWFEGRGREELTGLRGAPRKSKGFGERLPAKRCHNCSVNSSNDLSTRIVPVNQDRL